MRDLEIRGAGDLLGAEQSGHVAALGFELYVEMLHEVVAELSGERRVAARPVRVDARVDAYVPASYIASEALKIDLHRRLALVEDEDELRELEVATEDRYGPLPEPVANLFAIQRAKLKVAQLGADYLVFREREGHGRAGRARLGRAARAPRARRHGGLLDRAARGDASRDEELDGRAATRRCYAGCAYGGMTRRASLTTSILVKFSRLSSRCCSLRVLFAGCGGGEQPPRSQPDDVARSARQHVTSGEFQAALAEEQARA